MYCASITKTEPEKDSYDNQIIMLNLQKTLTSISVMKCSISVMKCEKAGHLLPVMSKVRNY